MKKLILLLTILSTSAIYAADRITGDSDVTIRGGNSSKPNKTILGPHYDRIRSQPQLFSTTKLESDTDMPSVIEKEEFTNSSWGLLYNYGGKLYVQRSKFCTLSDGSSGKCPTSARCSVENANNIDLCKEEVLPQAVESYFDNVVETFSSNPNILFQYIWNN